MSCRSLHVSSLFYQNSVLHVLLYQTSFLGIAFYMVTVIVVFDFVGFFYVNGCHAKAVHNRHRLYDSRLIYNSRLKQLFWI